LLAEDLLLLMLVSERVDDVKRVVLECVHSFNVTIGFVYYSPGPPGLTLTPVRPSVRPIVLTLADFRLLLLLCLLQLIASNRISV